MMQELFCGSLVDENVACDETRVSRCVSARAGEGGANLLEISRSELRDIVKECTESVAQRIAVKLGDVRLAFSGSCFDLNDSKIGGCFGALPSRLPTRSGKGGSGNGHRSRFNNSHEG